MATAIAPREDTAATDLEGRAQVESLDALHAQRRAKVTEYAPLAARFKGGGGQGSSSDAARKRHRALVAKKILVEMGNPIGKEAPSEAALERQANAHLEHIAFCEKLEEDFVKFIVLENEINELNERIRSREVELRCYNAEIQLR
jgi:hypothetical protein